MPFYPPLEGEGRSRSERGGVMTKRQIDRFKRLTAKRLRLNDTHAEDLLWRRLRQLELQGTHFRRQVVIGRYIADFACLPYHLIIEVDGSQHGQDANARYDDERTRRLMSEGFRVSQFWNSEIMTNIDAVTDAVYHALADTPPRLPSAGDPPPQGEGKGL